MPLATPIELVIAAVEHRLERSVGVGGKNGKDARERF
jgi:hypothetical protein